MRVAMVADVHVGNHKYKGGAMVGGLNRRCEIVIEALHRAKTVALDKDCDRLVVLGDLFDSSMPSPAMIAAVLHALEGIPTDLLVGNHDQTSVANHALAPFRYVPDITVHSFSVAEDYVADSALLFVPFMPGKASEWLPRVLKHVDPSLPHAMFLHLGIWDEHTPHFLQGARDAVPLELILELSERHNIIATFAGNWHQRRVLSEDPWVVIPGTIAPVNFRDSGEDMGHMVVWDPEDPAVEVQFIEVPGPRFYSISGNAKTAVPRARQIASRNWSEKNQLFMRLTLPPADLAAVTALNNNPFQDWPEYHFELIEDQAEMIAGAKMAAQAARSEASFDEALLEYLEQCPIDEPGTRDGVVQRVAQYRKAARE